ARHVGARVFAVGDAVAVRILVRAAVVLRWTRDVRTQIRVAEQAVMIPIRPLSLLDPVDLLLLARFGRLPGDAATEPERRRTEAARGAEAAAHRDRDPLAGLRADPEQELRRDLAGRIRERRQRWIAVHLADNREAPPLNNVR